MTTPPIFAPAPGARAGLRKTVAFADLTAPARRRSRTKPRYVTRSGAIFGAHSSRTTALNRSPSRHHRMVLHACRPETGLFNSPYVHFLQNAIGYTARNADDECCRDLRSLYHRRALTAPPPHLQACLHRWQQHLSAPHRVFRSRDPRDAQPANRASTPALHLPEFPNCLLPIRALYVHIHDGRLDEDRYLRTRNSSRSRRK